jgi:excinuclease UvrABC ATPase subunit
MGPGAGEKGGKVIFTGTPQQMTQSKSSITAKYL